MQMKLDLTKREWRLLDLVMAKQESSPEQLEVFDQIRNKASLAGLNDAPPIVGRHSWVIDIDDSPRKTIAPYLHEDADTIGFDGRTVRIKRRFESLEYQIHGGIPHRVVRRTIIENAHLLDRWEDFDDWNNPEAKDDYLITLTALINEAGKA
jgi:hypothetical protein